MSQFDLIETPSGNASEKMKSGEKTTHKQSHTNSMHNIHHWNFTQTLHNTRIHLQLQILYYVMIAIATHKRSSSSNQSSLSTLSG